VARRTVARTIATAIAAGSALAFVSRLSEFVTALTLAPNSSIEAPLDALWIDKEPDNAKKMPAYDFAFPAAYRSFHNRTCGLDHYRQELLAERSAQIVCAGWQLELSVGLRQCDAESSSCGESQRARFQLELSRRPAVVDTEDAARLITGSCARRRQTLVNQHPKGWLRMFILRRELGLIPEHQIKDAGTEPAFSPLE
jgi:hypothetical protein